MIVEKYEIPVVIAAGNEGPEYGTISSPGISKNAITVGAIDKNLILADFSSRGPTAGGRIKPDVVAPGVDIKSAELSGYNIASETSAATPFVTGVVALIRQAHPDWDPFKIKYAIMSTARDLGYNVYEQGARLVNAPKAITLRLLVFCWSLSGNHKRD